MKNFVKAFKEEKGVSLLEVIATLLISSIILIVVYNVFIMGIKTYEKVGVEMQLRDEADHIVASILKELYETPIDSVKPCDGIENCITISHDKKLKANEQFPSVIDETRLDAAEEIDITLEENEVQLTTRVGTSNQTTTNLLNEKYELLLGNEVDEKERSRIAIIDCIDEDNNDTTCEKGLIEIYLHLQDKNFTEDDLISADPIKLESKFGF